MSTMYGLLESVRGTTKVPGSARGKNCTQKTQLQDWLPLPNYIHCQPLVSKFCFLSHFLSELKFPLTIWRAWDFVQQPTEHNAWVALSAPGLACSFLCLQKRTIRCKPYCLATLANSTLVSKGSPQDTRLHWKFLTTHQPLLYMLETTYTYSQLLHC